MQRKTKVVTDRFTTLLVGMVLMCAVLLGAVPRVYAATNVTSRSDKVSDPRPGVSATHRVGFTYTDFTVPIGSVMLEFCSNDPMPATACTAPTGFDATGAILINQSGETGYSIHANSTANMIILTRPAAIPSQGASYYEFSNVINPTQEGTYYLRIQTFTATDGTGTGVQEGGVALSVNNPFIISTEVPPHLTFCVSVTIVNFDCSSANSFFVDLGELSKTQPRSATSQMIAASNAAFGYSIFATGTTFTSGNNIIPAPTSPTASAPGTSQFGINLRANPQLGLGDDPVGPGTAGVTANYAIPNRFMFSPGDSVASGTVSQDWRKFTVTYLVNVSNAQPAGVYATTLTYICLANF
jgi:hypothetical protein